MENLENEEKIGKKVITKEIAVKELQKFVEKYDDKKKEEWEIENEFGACIEAMQQGFLSFNEDSYPEYVLKNPIESTTGTVMVEKIEFKTRIKPTQLAEIMKGVDISKNQFEYTLRCLAFISKQPKAMLDKFSKFDYKAIEQISTVFL